MQPHCIQISRVRLASRESAGGLTGVALHCQGTVLPISVAISSRLVLLYNWACRVSKLSLHSMKALKLKGTVIFKLLSIIWAIFSQA